VSGGLQRLKTLGWAIALAGAAHGAAAASDAYPARPIRMIAPIAPGGGVDTMARSVGPELAARLGQPVVVDNRPGAGGSLGAELLAKSALRSSFTRCCTRRATTRWATLPRSRSSSSTPT
jgi:tripartite-type tricarboxylate transporter receptor subunit TctC